MSMESYGGVITDRGKIEKTYFHFVHKSHMD
jgi:hypothetical protein